MSQKPLEEISSHTLVSDDEELMFVLCKGKGADKTF